MSMMNKINTAKAAVQSRSSVLPETGIILGSGLGMLADQVEQPTVIPYRDIPHCPEPTVEGHAGEMIIGRLENKTVVLMKGRFHPYEGHDFQSVVFPIRLMRALGVRSLIVTNAAGGINPSFQAGDLMIIADHINLMFRNPLIGPNEAELGVRFPDMTEAYDSGMREKAKEAASELGLSIQEGIYAAMLGPSYETPAEIRMLSVLGADAVGMSTVPEVIAARHMGIRVLGISLIANMAAGISKHPLSHEEVMETGERVKEQFAALIRRIAAE